MQERLLTKINSQLDNFESCLNCFNEFNSYEDLVYRYYHQSFKVYHVQSLTERGRELLALCDPKDLKCFCEEYGEILQQGLGKKFNLEHNKRWTQETRPLIEAFFHTKYFLEMGLKYGLELERGKIPKVIPSGWAALLELYKIR